MTIKLFQIQDNDRQCYVIAENFQLAVDKWKIQMMKENQIDDIKDIEDPLGVKFLAENSFDSILPDIIL